MVVYVEIVILNVVVCNFFLNSSYRTKKQQSETKPDFGGPTWQHHPGHRAGISVFLTKDPTGCLITSPQT